MRIFRNILFVADRSAGERAALARAVRLALVNDAPLTLFDTVEAEAYPYLDPPIQRTVRMSNRSRLERRAGELAQLGGELARENPRLRVEAKVRLGRGDIPIVRAVLRRGHDLVMKAARHPGGLGRLFSRVDLKLMRKCPCPVYIVRPTSGPRFGRILAAVDLHPTDPETEPLARRILELAGPLAREEGSELHVLHAWRLLAEVQFGGRMTDTEEVNEVARQMEAAHRAALDDLLADFADEAVTAHLVEGRAGDVIGEAARRLEVDLIVIGTLGRTGVSGFLIGNTAERVLDSADCSVLTLKPEGFETPVQA